MIRSAAINKKWVSNGLMEQSVQITLAEGDTWSLYAIEGQAVFFMHGSCPARHEAVLAYDRINGGWLNVTGFLLPAHLDLFVASLGCQSFEEAIRRTRILLSLAGCDAIDPDE